MSKDVTSETVSTRLTGFSETDKQWLAATLENAGHDDAMLDGSTKLADITGPIVSNEAFHCLAGKLTERAIIFLRGDV